MAYKDPDEQPYDLYSIDNPDTSEVSTVTITQTLTSRVVSPGETMNFQFDSKICPAINPMETYLTGGLAISASRAHTDASSMPCLVTPPRSSYIGPEASEQNMQVLPIWNYYAPDGWDASDYTGFNWDLDVRNPILRIEATSDYPVLCLWGKELSISMITNRDGQDMILITCPTKDVTVHDLYQLLFSDHEPDNPLSFPHLIPLTVESPLLGDALMITSDNSPVTEWFVGSVGWNSRTVDRTSASDVYLPSFSIYQMNLQGDGSTTGVPGLTFTPKNVGGTHPLRMIVFTIGVTETVSYSAAKGIFTITANMAESTFGTLYTTLTASSEWNYDYTTTYDEEESDTPCTEWNIWGQDTTSGLELFPVQFVTLHSAPENPFPALDTEQAKAMFMYDRYCDSLDNDDVYESIAEAFMQALPCPPSNGIHGAFENVQIRTSTGRVIEQSADFSTLQKKLYQVGVDGMSKVNDSVFSLATLHTGPTGYATTGKRVCGNDGMARYFTEVVNPASPACQLNVSADLFKSYNTNAHVRDTGVLMKGLGPTSKGQIWMNFDTRLFSDIDGDTFTPNPDAYMSMFVPGTIVGVYALALDDGSGLRDDAWNVTDTIPTGNWMRIGWSRILQSKRYLIDKNAFGEEDMYTTDRTAFQIEAKQLHEFADEDSNVVFFETFQSGIDDSEDFISVFDGYIASSMWAPMDDVDNHPGLKYRYMIAPVDRVSLNTTLNFQVPLPSLMFGMGRVLPNLGYGLMFDIVTAPTHRFLTACEGMHQAYKNNTYTKVPIAFSNSATSGIQMESSYSLVDVGQRINIIRPPPYYAEQIQAAMDSQDGYEFDYIRWYESRHLIPSGTTQIDLQVPAAVQSKTLAVFAVPQYHQVGPGNLATAHYPTSVSRYGGVSYTTTNPSELTPMQKFYSSAYAQQRTVMEYAKEQAAVFEQDYENGIPSISDIQLNMFFEDNPNEAINLRSITSTPFVDKSSCPQHAQHLNNAMRAIMAELTDIDDLKGSFLFGFPLCLPGEFKTMDQSNTVVKLHMDKALPGPMMFHVFFAYVSRVVVSNSGNTVTTFN